MAVYTNLNHALDDMEVSYEGKVFNWYERNGYEDSDWYAEVWDDEKNAPKAVLFDTTRCGCAGHAEIDATPDVLRKLYRWYKKNATIDFDMRNEEMAQKPAKGDQVMVIKGRKVKKGTIAEVFWAGTRFNPYSYQDEERVGLVVDGEKVFISAENVEVLWWADKLVTGKARKEKIRKMAVNNMPYWCRKYFDK